MKFGMLAAFMLSTQPRRISRAAIQSVIVMMSQPVSWPAWSACWIVPKKVSLSSMTSWYFTWSPVLLVKASSVGCFFWSFGSTSM